MDLVGWQEIPEPVLIQIFRRLSVQDVFSCGLVCQRWYEVSRDNLLWKSLLRRDFKSKVVTLRPEATSWLSEYERLVNAVPKIKIQTLSHHTDEVLHVTFSHDGTEIVSCSKDHKIIVWKQANGIFSLHFSQDMFGYNWLHTWAAQFNESDTRLMVAGVVDQVSGEIAIFATGRDGPNTEYSLICRVVNDPYDVLGCWCTDQFFLSGTMTIGGENLLDAQIFLCVPDQAENNQLLNIHSYKRLLFKYRNLQGNIYVRYVQKHNRKKFQDNPCDWPSSKDNSFHFNSFPNQDLPELEDLTEEEMSGFLENEICIIFLCGDKTKIPHQLGFQRITRECLQYPPGLKGPERVIDFNGHVIGMAISPDERYLYVNVRTWPDNAIPSVNQPPPISNQIELQVIDLATLEKTGRPLTGHHGFTPSEKAFYLYVDVSKNLVGSGSEDKQGCLWDRHYEALVSHLPHDKCVNCVVICPTDEEICVSASDDKTLSVWTSKGRLKERPWLKQI